MIHVNNVPKDNFLKGSVFPVKREHTFWRESVRVVRCTIVLSVQVVKNVFLVGGRQF